MNLFRVVSSTYDLITKNDKTEDMKGEIMISRMNAIYWNIHPWVKLG